MTGFIQVVLKVTYFGTRTRDLGPVCRHLLSVAHVVLALYRPLQYVSQDFHVPMWMDIEVLIGVDDAVTSHSQGRGAHKIRVIMVGERGSMLRA